MRSGFDGIGEYRIDWGPGYRIYLAQDGKSLIVLLGGGTKKRQQKDIKTAKELYKEFAKAFKLADIVYIMDIYPAGESPLKGVSSNMILNAMPSNKTKVFQFKNALTVAKNLSKGDILLTIGAGDVWKVGEDIKLKFEIIN